MRRSGDGTLPVDGASGAFDWTGFATGDALPHQEDPASGRLVNANEKVTGTASTVFMGQDWYGDWRARRIRALLEERTRFTAASFVYMQLDALGMAIGGGRVGTVGAGGLTLGGMSPD